MEQRSKSLKFAAVIVTGLLATAPAIAAAMSAATPLPPEQAQGNVTYMSGGIGHEEAIAMRKEEGRFPLSLEFIKRAKPADESLANVNVTIKDHRGNTELQTLATGPYLLANMPNGKYKVSAEFDGQTKTHDVVVAAHKPARVVFEW